jgi:putative transposase
LWLFKSPILYSAFLTNLAAVKEKLRFKLYGYVLMPNHVHLLLYPPSGTTITQILWALKRPFAYQALRHLQTHHPEIYANLGVRKGERKLHRFWQTGGGYDRNIFRDETFVYTLDYMHLNPVRKKLVTDPLEWKWSSAGFYQTRQSGQVEIDYPEWW